MRPVLPSRLALLLGGTLLACSLHATPDPPPDPGPAPDRSAGATSTVPASAPAPPTALATEGGGAREVFWVSVLSTRRHTLDGRNPVVGVFRSADGGRSWTHTGWEQGKAVAVVAAGGRLVVAQGNGVHVSDDDGATWRIATDWRVTEVQDVAPDPGLPGRLFAATPYGVFRTEDGGETWEERSAGLPPTNGTFVSSVRVDRTRAGRAFAGTEAGLFRTDDAGGRWSPVGLSEPVRSIRQSPSDPSGWVAALQGRGLAVSEDGGDTWRYAGGLAANATLYEAEFHPTEDRTLFAGGWRTGVLVSRDGGRSWARSTQGLAETSVHALAVSRRDPRRLLAGTMGEGLYLSRDGGGSWERVAPDQFDTAQVWDVAVAGEW